MCVVVVGDMEMEEAVEEDSDQDRPFFFPMLLFDIVVRDCAGAAVGLGGSEC